MRLLAVIAVVVAAVCPLFAQEVAVVTANGNSQRTNVYQEASLAPEQVGRCGMRLWLKHTVDGPIQAHPLYVPKVPINGKPTDLIIVQTTHNTLYAFNANEGIDDSAQPDRCGGSPGSKARVWCRHLKDPEGRRPAANENSFATPVIALDKDSKIAYVVYSTTNRSLPLGCVCGEKQCAGCPDETVSSSCKPDFDTEFWLAAIDVATGAEVRTRKIEAKPGQRIFHAYDHRARPALLLDHDSVYVAFGMRALEEAHDYHGWVMWFDRKSLELQGSLCTTPNVTNRCGVRKGPHIQGEGAGIWQSGGGLAADAEGAVYFVTSNGNGKKDAYGDSVVRIGPKSGGPTRAVSAFDAVAAELNPSIRDKWLHRDIDLGSGGPVVIPGTPWIVVGGKTGVFYVLNQSDMTLRQKVDDIFFRQWKPDCRYDAWEGGPHLHGPATYWQVKPDRGYLFHWPENDHLKRVTINPQTGMIDPKSLLVAPDLTEPPLHPALCKGSDSLMPGGMTALSANGDRDGILWVTLPDRWVDLPPGGHQTAGLLMAFDAETLKKLWQSDTPFAKFAPPVVAGGQVMIVGIDTGTIQTYKLSPVCNGRTVPAEGNEVRPTPTLYANDRAVTRVTSAMAYAGDAARRIAPPAGARLLFTVELHGRQRYRAVARNGKLAWQPSITTGDLIDDSLRHPEGGPMIVGKVRGARWTWEDGSRMTVAESASAAVEGGSTAPWQLLKATAHSGEGLLADVAYLQRFDTGVIAPTAPPKRRSDETSRDFVAAYALYAAEQHVP